MVHRLDDGLHVGEALGGLLGRAAGDQLAVSAEGQLGGDVVVVGEGHGLGGEGALRGGVGVVRLDDETVTVLDGLGRGAVAMGHHGLHGHVAVEGQVVDGHHGAGRQVVHGAGDAGIGEEGLVHLVHGLHIGQVLHEDGHLHDVVQGHVHRLQDGLHVLQALGGLGGRIAQDRTARLRAQRQLHGDVVVVGERHGLGGEGVVGSAVGVVGELHQVAGLGHGLSALAVIHKGLDEHEGILGQAVHGHHGAGGLVGGEEGGLHLLHGIQIHDVGQVDGQADDVVHVVADALHDGLDVLEALLGLLGGAAGHDGTRRRVDGQLGREVVVVGERHGLRIEVAYGRLLGVAGHYHVRIGHWYPLQGRMCTVLCKCIKLYGKGHCQCRWPIKEPYAGI